VPSQLVQVKPGPSYVAELSREIERVDVHLSNFKRWQASSTTALADQEQQLQVCVCMCVCVHVLVLVSFSNERVSVQCVM
jgi:hypothetical protein